eukprot:2141288-Amphidinium_carterae.1
MAANPCQVMMTLCLQMMTFSYLMRTLKLLVFVMNPLTWIDVVHFRDEWGQASTVFKSFESLASVLPNVCGMLHPITQEYIQLVMLRTVKAGCQTPLLGSEAGCKKTELKDRAQVELEVAHCCIMKGCSGGCT